MIHLPEGSVELLPRCQVRHSSCQRELVFELAVVAEERRFVVEQIPPKPAVLTWLPEHSAAVAVQQVVSVAE